MKFTHIRLAMALACGLHVQSWAASPEHSMIYPASDYSYFAQEQAQPSPSDVPPAPAPEGEMMMKDAGAGMCCDFEEPTCDPWRLFNQCEGGWNLYGFINAGAAANADRPPSHYNGPVTFFDREDLRLSQLYAILEKKADPYCGSGWGGRIDLLYGTDYVFTQAVGLETNPDGTNSWNRESTNIPGALAMYGLAMPQAYAEYAVNDLSLKFGHFYAPVGYQVVPATGNFFITQPYTFQYGEPFTFTGALATWQYSEQLSVQAGVVNGWDKFDAQTDRASFVGTFTYAPTHGAYTLFNATVIGDEDGTTPPIVGQRFLNTLVFTFNITENTQYVVQNDIGQQENGVGPGVDAEWYGINQYLFYTINECWKLGARGEWFRDDDGVRLQSFPIRLGGLANLGVAGLPASAAGDYYNLAAGLSWSPTANLTIRQEARWDWSEGTAIAPYDDFTKDSQFMAAVDMILLY